MSDAGVRRRALVIGSQCDTLGEARKLSFLPDLATELYQVLIDPRLGACEPALPDRSGGGLLLDPTRLEVRDALQVAFAHADSEKATLLVALLGHGVVHHDDFYFLTVDALGTGDEDRDVFLSHRLKQLLANSSELGGLVVWLDTCQSGVAAQQAAAQWGSGGAG
jgi:hypothetical protein